MKMPLRNFGEQFWISLGLKLGLEWNVLRFSVM